MARYLGSACVLCRREAEKLYLKGDRCYTPKCAIEKRNYPPGPHGQSGSFRRKTSDYATQLREKQKARRIYGVSPSVVEEKAEVQETASGDGAFVTVVVWIDAKAE